MKIILGEQWQRKQREDDRLAGPLFPTTSMPVARFPECARQQLTVASDTATRETFTPAQRSTVTCFIAELVVTVELLPAAVVAIALVVAGGG